VQVRQVLQEQEPSQQQELLLQEQSQLQEQVQLQVRALPQRELPLLQVPLLQELPQQRVLLREQLQQVLQVLLRQECRSFRRK
jgi:hypothetical protein